MRRPSTARNAKVLARKRVVVQARAVTFGHSVDLAQFLSMASRLRREVPACAAGVLSMQNAEAVIAPIMALEALDDASSLMATLAD